MKFEELNLVSSLYQAIQAQNIETCTDIQEKAIPHILEGRDVSGLSQTGTGKTFAFLVPMIDKILRSKQNSDQPSPELQKRVFSDWRTAHFVLILAPTRELVEQIYNVAKILGKPCGIKSTTVIGGVDYEPQKEALVKGVDIVIGTPGRLLDLYKNHIVHFKDVRAIIFDEADRMFDMGFKDDMNFILQRCPPERQILLFSATLNFDVLNTAYRFGSHPIELNISRDQAKAVDVEDEIFHIGEEAKPTYLISILRKEKPKQCIIFSNFKNQVERITEFLNINNLPAVGISSLLTQAQRDRVMTQFRNENEVNILVATDLAARGLDIKGVDLVINVELPEDAENYVHRIGRTGRAGSKGKAYSMVSDRDVSALSRIEDYLKQKIKIGWIEDSELIHEFKTVPREDYKSSHIKKTGLAASKDRPPFEQSVRRPRPQRPRHAHSKNSHLPNVSSQSSRSSHSTRPLQSENIHRDRRTKRHSENHSNAQSSQQLPQANKYPRQQKHHKFNGSKQQLHNKNIRSYRHGQPSRTQSQKSSPIVSKFTQFFKKLFE